MKNIDEIKKIMSTIPKEWQEHWCGGEHGMCACMGCVQIGNRMIMYEKATGNRFYGDPEYINEASIPVEIYEKYKISKEEWFLWIDSMKV